MKFRLSKARGVHPELLLDTSGQVVSGKYYTLRTSLLTDEALRGYDHAPEFDFHLREYSRGQYARLTEGGLYNIYRDTTIWNELSPIYIADNNDFTQSGLGVVPDGWFGDGSDGDVTIPVGTTTLTRDMFYNNLTVPSGAILQSGFRIYVKKTLQLDGVIHNNGGNGQNGTNGSFSITDPCPGSLGYTPGGPGGVSAQVGYFLSDPGAGLDGTRGEDLGSSGATQNGVQGTSVSLVIGQVGVAGVGGGAGGSSSLGGGRAASTGGAAGTVTTLLAKSGTMRNLFNALVGRAFASDNTLSAWNTNGHNGSSGGGSTGTGACVFGSLVGTGGTGGGAGGNGANGGVCCVIAMTVRGGGSIQSKGGNAGNGGKGGDGQTSGGFFSGAGGGGGGGQGGNGGTIIFVYYDKTAFIGTTDVSAGLHGGGGLSGSNTGMGNPATAGQNGNDGVVGITLSLFAI